MGFCSRESNDANQPFRWRAWERKPTARSAREEDSNQGAAARGTPRPIALGGDQTTKPTASSTTACVACLARWDVVDGASPNHLDRLESEIESPLVWAGDKRAARVTHTPPDITYVARRTPRQDKRARKRASRRLTRTPNHKRQHSHAANKVTSKFYFGPFSRALPSPVFRPLNLRMPYVHLLLWTLGSAASSGSHRSIFEFAIDDPLRHTRWHSIKQNSHYYFSFSYIFDLI